MNFANSGVHPSILYVFGRSHVYKSIAFHAIDIHRILYLIPDTLSHEELGNSKRFQKYLIFCSRNLGQKFVSLLMRLVVYARRRSVLNRNNPMNLCRMSKNVLYFIISTSQKF